MCEAGKRILVTHEAPDGTPRAFAIGPANDPDGVREEAQYHLDAYKMERTVLGDPLGSARFVRREVVLG